MNASANRSLRLAVPAVLIVSSGSLWGAPGDVKTSFDAPCKYPSGLASDGRHLFVADWRSAKIHQVSHTDGTVIRSWDAPTLKPHGLAYARDRLFICDDHTGSVYTLNLDTGIAENTFQAPNRKATSPNAISSSKADAARSLFHSDLMPTTLIGSVKGN